MASLKDDHYPVCGWISGMIVSFQPDTDARKLVLIWNRIRIRIFDLKRFIWYFEDSGGETTVFVTFDLSEKVAHWIIIYLLPLEASFQLLFHSESICTLLKAHFWIVFGYG